MPRAGRFSGKLASGPGDRQARSAACAGIEREGDRSVAVRFVLRAVLAAAEDGAVLHLHPADPSADADLPLGDEGALVDAVAVAEGAAVQEEVAQHPLLAHSG